MNWTFPPGVKLPVLRVCIFASHWEQNILMTSPGSWPNCLPILFITKYHLLQAWKEVPRKEGKKFTSIIFKTLKGKPSPVYTLPGPNRAQQFQLLCFGRKSRKACHLQISQSKIFLKD